MLHEISRVAADMLAQSGSLPTTGNATTEDSEDMQALYNMPFISEHLKNDILLKQYI